MMKTTHTHAHKQQTRVTRARVTHKCKRQRDSRVYTCTVYTVTILNFMNLSVIMCCVYWTEFIIKQKLNFVLHVLLTSVKINLSGNFCHVVYCNVKNRTREEEREKGKREIKVYFVFVLRFTKWEKKRFSFVGSLYIKIYEIFKNNYQYKDSISLHTTVYSVYCWFSFFSEHFSDFSYIYHECLNVWMSALEFISFPYFSIGVVIVFNYMELKSTLFYFHFHFSLKNVSIIQYTIVIWIFKQSGSSTKHKGWKNDGRTTIVTRSTYVHSRFTNGITSGVGGKYN